MAISNVYTIFQLPNLLSNLVNNSTFPLRK